jgi:hypothetical protein
MSLLPLLAAALFAASTSTPAAARAVPRCPPEEITMVSFRPDAAPYSVEQGPCGAVILDGSDLPVYVLQSPLRTLEVLPLADGAQALLVGVARGAEETEYSVLAWSRGEVRALQAPDMAALAGLAEGELFSRGAVVEAAAGGVLVDAPVAAREDPGCCASRGRVLAMLGLQPDRGRLVLLGIRRER